MLSLTDLSDTVDTLCRLIVCSASVEFACLIQYESKDCQSNNLILRFQSKRFSSIIFSRNVQTVVTIVLAEFSSKFESKSQFDNCQTKRTIGSKFSPGLYIKSDKPNSEYQVLISYSLSSLELPTVFNYTH